MNDQFLTAKQQAFIWNLQDAPDLELAEAYAHYIDSPGSMYFSEIFWEANRRGLSLSDLEQILHDEDQ